VVGDCYIYWNTTGQLESAFVDVLITNNFLYQYIDTVTIARGSSVPHLLDLVMSDEPFIEDIDFKAPLGKVIIV